MHVFKNKSRGISYVETIQLKEGGRSKSGIYWEQEVEQLKQIGKCEKKIGDIQIPLSKCSIFMLWRRKKSGSIYSCNWYSQE